MGSFLAGSGKTKITEGSELISLIIIIQSEEGGTLSQVGQRWLLIKTYLWIVALWSGSRPSPRLRISPADSQGPFK